jgi:SAM-dependent methyltransferase
VHHLDAVCRGAIAALYQRFLTPGQRVLDLMSSWTSHLPDAGPEIEITGLGMNREELEANARLRLRLLHDLNEVPALPVRNDGFDLALCTASVEYLTHPHAVFQDLVRVLRPGGRFVVSFSDRWFPTKVIGAWSELHPFERMGLVVSLFRSAEFTDLHTETLRGLRRPADDKYTDLRDHSDPLFAVWGSKPL